MLKLEFLKRLGIGAIALPLALAKGNSKAEAAAPASDALIGMWQANVVTKEATFKYIYCISDKSYVCTGNLDENYQGFKFSPTMGTYTQNSDGSYTYVEHGWVFDLKGTCVGSFQSAGSLRLNDNGATFGGPGKFTQFDLHGKAVYSEPFKVSAKRVSPQPAT